MKTLISVIVPIYKTEVFLPRCIETILNQSYKNLEIILINDGSPDQCGKICDEYTNKDGRIKVIHQENKGVSAARNRGISVASGEYISFVDSDDCLIEDMYENMLRLSEKYDADIVQCGRVNLTENREIDTDVVEEKIEVLNSYESLKELMCSHKVRSSTCDKLYRRILFEHVKFDDRLSAGEDFVLNYYLVKKCRKLITTTRVGYLYCDRNDSCTKGNIKSEHFMIFETLSELLSKENDEELIKYWKLRKAMFAMNFLRRMIPENDFSKFDEFRKYMVDVKFVLGSPLKYKVSKDKHFVIHVLVIWLMPKMYIWLIKRNSKNT